MPKISSENIRNKYNISFSIWINIIRTLKIFWKIDRNSLIGYLILIILSNAGNIFTVYFTSRIVGQLALVVQNKYVSTSHIYLFLAGSALSLIVQSFSNRWMTFIQRKSWIKFYVYNTSAIDSKVSSLDMSYHQDNEFEKKVNKISQSYGYLPQNYNFSIIYLLQGVLGLVTVLGVISYFNPFLIIIMVVSLIPGYYAEKKFSKLKWNLWDEEGDKNLLAWKSNVFLTDKNKLQETKIFQTNDHIFNLLSKLKTDFYSKQLVYMKNAKKNAIYGILSEEIVGIGIILWLVKKVINHTLNLANYTFYSGIILQFSSSLRGIVFNLNSLYDDNEYMKDFYWILDLKPLITNSENAVVLPKDNFPIIEFENVSFKYPKSEEFSLRNLSFKIDPGDKIAFVGENGAGKTSMIKLLLRFYDPSEGRILVNGTDLKEIDLSSYYYHIGVLFQDFNQYPYNVRDNIALGRVEDFSNDKKVRESAIVADADKFINEYPNKYNQILETAFKDGIDPSGGQWQRIALSRALFRNASVLILDEPTAAVDSKAEYEIFKTLDKNTSDKTTIIISHRFSTVRKAKKIYVMKSGEIIEEGKHNDLLKIKNGLYKDMFTKQAEGYK